MPTFEALIFGTNRRATFLQACVFARIIDAVHFFINFPTLLFRKDQHNRTLVPYAFLAVSLAEMAQSDVEICLLPSSFHRLRREPQSLIVRTLPAQADSFNACNQLWNANRLGKKWICGADRRKCCFSTT